MENSSKNWTIRSISLSYQFSVLKYYILFRNFENCGFVFLVFATNVLYGERSNNSWSHTLKITKFKWADYRQRDREFEIVSRIDYEFEVPLGITCTLLHKNFKARALTKVWRS